MSIGPELQYFFLQPSSRQSAFARNEYHEAEALLGRFLDGGIERAKNRPQLLEAMVDYAESLFGQDQHETAYVALFAARTQVTRNSMPPPEVWRKTLETWLQRAHDLGRPDLVASLEAEIQAIPATANRGITILEKFRISPPAE